MTPEAATRHIRRSVGVEEEYLLTDASGERTAAAAGLILHDLHDDPRVRGEFKQEQIEAASRPREAMCELSSELEELREMLSSAAARHEVRILASGTFAGAVTPTAVRGDRFDRIAAEFADLADRQLTCGMHVHVEVGSRQEGVDVLDRIRPWLAGLTALSANSPYWQGRDTGCASYRSIVLSQLPTAGPTPLWGSVAAYDETLDALIATGAVLDAGMVYFDARLSARFPTVEIRVTDVCVTVHEAVMLAAVCRALVDTASQQADAGRPAPGVAVGVLRCAAWRAARRGMSDTLYDASTGRLAPAWAVIDHLMREVDASLAANGDDVFVGNALSRLRQLGTGADRQREAFSRVPAVRRMASGIAG